MSIDSVGTSASSSRSWLLSSCASFSARYVARALRLFRTIRSPLAVRATNRARPSAESLFRVTRPLLTRPATIAVIVGWVTSSATASWVTRNGPWLSRCAITRTRWIDTSRCSKGWRMSVPAVAISVLSSSARRSSEFSRSSLPVIPPHLRSTVAGRVAGSIVASALQQHEARIGGNADPAKYGSALAPGRRLRRSASAQLYWGAVGSAAPRSRPFLMEGALEAILWHHPVSGCRPFTPVGARFERPRYRGGAVDQTHPGCVTLLTREISIGTLCSMSLGCGNSLDTAPSRAAVGVLPAEVEGREESGPVGARLVHLGGGRW